MIDQFAQYRQEYKGIFIATKDQKSTKVLANAMDYSDLEDMLKKKGLLKKSIAIQYLEPKKAICAYGPFLLGRVGLIERFEMLLSAKKKAMVISGDNFS